MEEESQEDQGDQEDPVAGEDSAALGGTVAARAHPSEGDQGKGAAARASSCDQHPGRVSPLHGEGACPRCVGGPGEPTPKRRRYLQGRCTEYGRKECWRQETRCPPHTSPCPEQVQDGRRRESHRTPPRVRCAGEAWWRGLRQRTLRLRVRGSGSLSSGVLMTSAMTPLHHSRAGALRRPQQGMSLETFHLPSL